MSVSGRYHIRIFLLQPKHREMRQIPKYFVLPRNSARTVLPFNLRMWCNEVNQEILIRLTAFLDYAQPVRGWSGINIDLAQVQSPENTFLVCYCIPYGFIIIVHKNCFLHTWEVTLNTSLPIWAKIQRVLFHVNYFLFSRQFQKYLANSGSW